MSGIEVIPFIKEGKEISWFCKDGVEYVPVRPVFVLHGVEDKVGFQIIDRNMELFQDMVVDIPIEEFPNLDPMMRKQFTSGRGKVIVVKCFTLAGYLQWVSLLDYKRYDLERQQMIISMRRWLVETGRDAIIKKEKPALAPLQMGIGDVFLQCNMITDKIVEKHHVEPIIATQLALKETQKITGNNMDGFIKLLPPVPTSEIALLTPTDISNKREMRSSREVNKMLQMMGMQERRKIVNKKGKESNDWFPTETGKEYCFSFPYVNNGHSGYQLKWKESILPLMDEWERKNSSLFSY